MSTKMSSESAIEDVIKIELSSDDESQMDNYSSVQSRTICENTQEEEHSSSSGLMDFDPKEYSLQETSKFIEKKIVSNCEMSCPNCLFVSSVFLLS